MATESTIKCDVCGTPKREVNHWYRVREDANSFRILKPHVKSKSGDHDVCGQAHLHTLVDRHLEEQMNAAKANLTEAPVKAISTEGITVVEEPVEVPTEAAEAATAAA